MTQSVRNPSDGAKPTGKIVGLAPLAEQLLELLETEAGHHPTPTAQEFRQQIGQLRGQMNQAAEAGDVASLGSACVELVRHYLAGWRSHVSEREAGLRGLIGLLRESLTTLAADAGSFNTDLKSASDRVSALAEIDDIRVLKNRLAEEVAEITQAIVEKQQRDRTAQEQLARRVKTLESTLAETQASASVDPLTQVANRGQFDRTLLRWVEAYRQQGKVFVLVFMDIDHFKTINDTHGHQAGDDALRGVAQILQASVRPCDIVARYGGDEFVLLLADMSLGQVEKRVPEIVSRIAATEFGSEAPADTPGVRFTVSCGMAELSRHDTAELLVERADRALYTAKKQGRNCAVGKRSSRWQAWISRERA